MRRLFLPLILCTLFLSGCAYYNTFYNAKKQFKKAEESYKDSPPEVGLASGQRELYEQAIKKASKVLTFYPNSKYADDALFMVGKAYFRMEALGKAQRKFEELLANYPQSKFRWETYYLLGTTLYYLDDLTRSRDALSAVIDANKKNDWADDAQFLLGEMAFDIGDYQQAVEEYSRIPEVYPKSPLKADALSMMGECHFKLGNYQEALVAFQGSREHEVLWQKRYMIDLCAGECHLKLSEYQQALATFERLARSDRYIDHLPQIRLRIAEVYYFMGDSVQAIQDYEEIIKKNPKTKEAAWAYYQLGLIQMENFDHLSVAKDYFDKSKSEFASSEAAGLASLKRSQINKLEEYQQKVAASDSLQDVQMRFALAEAYLLDFDRPDSALVHYQKVVELVPLSKYAPPSAFTAAWIVENITKDTVKGQQMYQDLIAAYPFSESANAARERLNQPAVVDTSDQNVAERFRRAEDLLLKDNDVDGALAQYQSIVADFPLSPYAPKAECARAWTLEYMKGDLDSARTIFKQLAEKYPDSECAALAQKKIAPPPVATPVDTTTPAPADTTTPAAADTTVQATTNEELEGREEGEEGIQTEEELDRRRPGRRQ